MFLFRLFFPRIRLRAWKRMEQQARLLHEWCAANHEYDKQTVTLCDDVQLLQSYGPLNFCASLVTMGDLKKTGAFSLTPGVNSIVLLQDGSIAVRGNQVRHYIRADRTTLDAKRFNEVADVVESWAAFLEIPAVSSQFR